jgi:ActR/RegA family two-component response regulator
METRGFEVETAPTVQDGLSSLRRRPPAFAVVDMRLDDGSGIDVIAALKDVRPEAAPWCYTGYGNIATAVTAVKLGAVDYLAKPADADDVYQALIAPGDGKAPPSGESMSADRVRWEHIQRVYELCNAMSRRLRAGSTCIAARCSASSQARPEVIISLMLRERIERCMSRSMRPTLRDGRSRDLLRVRMASSSDIEPAAGVEVKL